MIFNKIMSFLARGEIPGIVWRINAFEAHCIMMALDALASYYNEEDMDFIIWQRIIAVEERKLNLRNVREISTHTEILPADHDRIFMEVLLKAERARLAGYPPDTPCYDCGGTVYDHENALREWLEREIEFPKRFALSRRKFFELPYEKKISNIKYLARQDAEKIVEQEVERLRRQLLIGDIPILEAKMQISHETTIKNAREQLLAILENYIID